MTRQRALFKSKRRGDSGCAIATRFTCQRALCNRGKRQGDSSRVIATRFTCQRALCNRGKRQGDSQRVIATRLTCQRALCNRGKRQGDSQRAIDTDLVHGSSTYTAVQNRVQFREKQSRSYEKLLELMNNYENLSETVKALHFVNELFICENHVDIWDTRGDLGNESKVNRTCNLKTYDNRTEKPTSLRPLPNNNDSYAHLSAFTIQTKHINSKSNAFNRSSGRSRCIARHFVHVNTRDREPSRIAMKKLVHSMSKNKKRRHKIKSFIRRLIPKSSALHNLLSTRYRKHFSQKLTNINMWQFWKPCRSIKMQKYIKKGNLKITNMRPASILRTLNNSKILSTDKCNIQRVKTSDKRLLLVCGDIELNPGPVAVNISSMSVLTTRLARIGRKPVNTIGDGNCFFRSVSHQLYGTEDRHPQIRALAIQHLINCPEHFVEYNTHQSWLQYLQSMSRLGTWADHIIIQAVANANNLRINITESEPSFSESTTVSPICAESETQRRNFRDIYVGHLEELHYVSTTPIRPVTQSISTEINYETTSNKPKAIPRTLESNKTCAKETATTKDLEKRKQYMKEYMKQRRKDQVFKKKETKRKKSYNKNYKNSNPEKVRESWQKATATYRKSNPEKVKQSCKKATDTYMHANPEKTKQCRKRATSAYRKSNPEKLRELFKISTASYRKLNPEKVKESSKKSTASYRKLNPEKVKESSKESTASYRKLHPEKVKESFKKSTASYRKLNPKKVKKSCNMATATYRQSKPEKVADSFKNSSRIYHQNYPERVQNIQKKKYMKRKQAYNDNEHESEDKRLKISPQVQDNSFQTMEENSGCARS